MNSDNFEKLVQARLGFCHRTLHLKADEYASDRDRLHNFKLAAALQGCTPEAALLGMWSKHIVSVVDIIKEIELGDSPGPSYLSEKITDVINYAILLEALIEERQAKEVDE